MDIWPPLSVPFLERHYELTQHYRLFLRRYTVSRAEILHAIGDTTRQVVEDWLVLAMSYERRQLDSKAVLLDYPDFLERYLMLTYPRPLRLIPPTDTKKFLRLP